MPPAPSSSSLPRPFSDLPPSVYPTVPGRAPVSRFFSRLSASTLLPCPLLPDEVSFWNRSFSVAGGRSSAPAAIETSSLPSSLSFFLSLFLPVLLSSELSSSSSFGFCALLLSLFVSFEAVEVFADDWPLDDVEVVLAGFCTEALDGEAVPDVTTFGCAAVARRICSAARLACSAAIFARSFAISRMRSDCSRARSRRSSSSSANAAETNGT